MISGNSGDGPTSQHTVEVSAVHDTLTVDLDRIRRLVHCVIEAENVEVRYLGIILCGQEYHRTLHERFLDDPSPTDVLAFDLEPESETLEGEVYVDLDTALERHSEFGSSFEEEVDRYVVHGLLHLAGYRDKEKAAAREMSERQEFLLHECRNGQNRVR